ncbi:branched-chain amino acid transport system permease protein [Mesorhizobium albiziae]|uniref:Branched-chain amino acid transport system permease protein n=1 Tax=Neomesorhizobium albiziae TaxID=335020 RepID=A0A1I4A1B3_9HYPH|nr:branched-chain amino acid ABC transporter permease [Mesorhizobium albiziae]GLS33995.1 branched-chain amino acid ABC transporter permease [Mesorhizobium albiziae]SFK50164.1 branched-chain amino acid transport system permease protein [Mesorhizobium albiziae]
MLYFFQQVLNGVHASAIYALLAFGYALTNSVIRRTNLAYGALFAFSGQAMILVAVFGWYVLWLTLPATVALGIAAGFGYAALVSNIFSRAVFAPLAESSPNTIVAATLGVSLVLMELARIAAETRDFWLPPMLAEPVVFASADGFRATLTVIQLVNCVVAALAILGLTVLLSRSTFGRHLRAVSDDPAAARMCGVDVQRIFHLAVIFGGLIAALAGILAGLYYGNISFGTGLIFGLKILFVTAVGGYNSPPRAALGAVAFGMAETLWTGYFPVEWRDAAVFLALVAILVLQSPDKQERPVP